MRKRRISNWIVRRIHCVDGVSDQALRSDSAEEVNVSHPIIVNVPPRLGTPTWSQTNSPISTSPIIPPTPPLVRVSEPTRMVSPLSPYVSCMPTVRVCRIPVAPISPFLSPPIRPSSPRWSPIIQDSQPLEQQYTCLPPAREQDYAQRSSPIGRPCYYSRPPESPESYSSIHELSPAPRVRRGRRRYSISPDRPYERRRRGRSPERRQEKSPSPYCNPRYRRSAGCGPQSGGLSRSPITDGEVYARRRDLVSRSPSPVLFTVRFPGCPSRPRSPPTPRMASPSPLACRREANSPQSFRPAPPPKDVVSPVPLRRHERTIVIQPGWYQSTVASLC